MDRLTVKRGMDAPSSRFVIFFDNSTKYVVISNWRKLLGGLYEAAGITKTATRNNPVGDSLRWRS